MLRLSEIAIHAEHPAGTFGTAPIESRRGVTRGGRLVVVATPVPGSAYPILFDMAVNGTRAAGLVDTGCSGSLLVEPELANQARLPLRGMAATQSVSEALWLQTCWIDGLAYGQRRAWQLIAAAATLPAFPQMSASNRPRLLLGGNELMFDSPVFDLAGEALWFRGDDAVTPLEEFVQEITGEENPKSKCVSIDFDRTVEPGLTTMHVAVEVNGRSVRALFDTGGPSVLRLTVSALRALELPTSRRAWIERGAVEFATTAVGGGRSNDLLVRLPSVRFGPVEFVRPVVLLAGFDQADEQARKLRSPVSMDAYVGFGALLPFRRIGIDWQRGKIELQVAGDQDRARIVVPDPGEFAGLELAVGGMERDAPRVLAVVPGSPAHRAGLRAGDRVLQVGGESATAQPLYQVIGKFWRPRGSELVVRIARPERAKSSVVTLGF